MDKLLVPQKLAINEILENYSSEGVKGFKKDKVYCICDSIYHGMEKLDSFNIHPDKKEPYFVPLNSEILRKVLGGNCYKGILEWMETAGIITADNSWQTEKVAQGYRFTDHYLNSDLDWKTVTYGILKKKEISIYIKKQYFYRRDVAQQLESWFDSNLFQIESDFAFETINFHLACSLKLADGNMHKIRQLKLNAFADMNKVQNILNGKFNLNQDPFGYRLHSELTRLPKYLRSLVSFDGKPLVEVDLSCSQLFFSCYLLNLNNWKSKYTNTLFTNISNNSKDISSIVVSNTTMYINLEVTICKDLFKNGSFLKRCCEGSLYESIVDSLDSENYFPADFDYKGKRNKVKTLLLDQLFANPFDKKHQGLFCDANKPIIDHFTALYPEAAYVFKLIKQGNYKDLCCLLQRIESIAMQGFVCDRILREYPDLPIFTLHDCLITTSGNETLIQEIMKEEITKFMSITPKMKIKNWSDYSEMIPEDLRLQKAA